ERLEPARPVFVGEWNARRHFRDALSGVKVVSLQKLNAEGARQRRADETLPRPRDTHHDEKTLVHRRVISVSWTRARGAPPVRGKGRAHPQAVLDKPRSSFSLIGRTPGASTKGGRYADCDAFRAHQPGANQEAGEGASQVLQGRRSKNAGS